MAQDQNYTVSYKIEVDATKGTAQVQDFASAVKILLLAKNEMTPAINNIKNMMNEIDKAFRTRSGKKRDAEFNLQMQLNSDL